MSRKLSEAEYLRQYRAKNPGKSLEWTKRWQAKNPEKLRASQRAYRESNREAIAKRKHENWLKTKSKNPFFNSDINRRNRLEALDAYGRRCACCGETTLAFLTIDHINNDGAEHRRSIVGGGSGSTFIKWLKRNGYPKDNFQVLCFNCNCAKSKTGVCPHESMRNLVEGRA